MKRILVFAAAMAFARAAHAQEDLTPPTVVTHVDAVYPAGAVEPGKHADVVLAVTVDAHGNVSKVDVLESGGKALDDAAVAAVRQWKFSPARRRGQPIAARVKVPFHFAPLNPPPDVQAPKGDHVIPGNVVAPGGKTGVTGPSQGALGGPIEPPGVETVQVRGRSLPPSRGASDFNLKVGALGNIPRANAAELLKLAPGILLTNAGGDGHADQVFLRGFDAREGQDIEFSIGGVPINEAGNLHGNGYADLHFIIPELVESLRVVEGPFDPRQGNYAVAGSANYELALAKRGLVSKYTMGSFGMQRMLLLWGPRETSSRTFAGAELFKTDGFGQNREARRGTAMAQYEGRVGESGIYRLTATAYSNAYKSAGLLRDDDYRRGRKDFFDTYDRRQGGESSRFSLSGDLEMREKDGLYQQNFFFIQRSMRLQENFTGFLLDTQEPLQSPHGQRGDLLDLSFDAQTFGARGSGRWRTRMGGQPQDLEIGYFARGDRTNATQHRIESRTGFPYKTENDLGSTLGDLGLFGDAIVRPLPWLSARGGIRADLFTYDVLDRCAARDVRQPSRDNPPGDATCLSQQDQGRYREPQQRATTASTAVMPRGSLIFGPIQRFTFSLSYGQGVRSIDPVYINQDLRTPFSRIEAYEGGITFASRLKGVDLVAKSILFRTHVDRDLIFSESAGRATLANGTTRTGWAGTVRATGRVFDQSANVTVVKSVFDDSGLLVPYVPDLVIRSDSSLFGDLPWKFGGEALRGALSAGITYVGNRALPFGQRSDVIFTVDASATVSWKMVEVGLQATNLFDRRYRLGEYNFPSDFRSQTAPTLVPARHFTAGAPRALFLSLALHFGGP